MDAEMGGRKDQTADWSSVSKVAPFNQNNGILSDSDSPMVNQQHFRLLATEFGRIGAHEDGHVHLLMEISVDNVMEVGA